MWFYHLEKANKLFYTVCNYINKDFVWEKLQYVVNKWILDDANLELYLLSKINI